MLYVGVTTDANDKPCMYVSSVSLELTKEDAYDMFEDNSFHVPFSSRAQQGDPIAQSAELGVLRNKLVAGGVQVVIES